MDKIEQRLSEIETDVHYCKKMLEDLTMRLSGSDSAKQALEQQMNILKNTFANVPGLPPHLKEQFQNIFNNVGGK